MENAKKPKKYSMQYYYNMYSTTHNMTQVNQTDANKIPYDGSSSTHDVLLQVHAFLFLSKHCPVFHHLLSSMSGDQSL